MIIDFKRYLEKNSPDRMYNFSPEQIKKMDPDIFFDAMDMSGGGLMPYTELKMFLDNANNTVRNTNEFLQYQGVLFGHEIHLFFGGISLE